MICSLSKLSFQQQYRSCVVEKTGVEQRSYPGAMVKRSPGIAVQVMLTSGLILPSETGPRPEKSDTSSSVAPKEYRKRPEMVLPTAIAFFPVAGDMTLHSPAGVTSPSFPAAKTSTCPGFCCSPSVSTRRTGVIARGVGAQVAFTSGAVVEIYTSFLWESRRYLSCYCRPHQIVVWLMEVTSGQYPPKKMRVANTWSLGQTSIRITCSGASPRRDTCR